MMCAPDRYLLENAKNSNSSAKFLCVKRCPVFYKTVAMKNVRPSKKTQLAGATGNEDSSDPIRANAAQRKDYFEKKEKYERGEIDRATMETARTAVGVTTTSTSRLLATKSKSGKLTPDGKPIDAADEELVDLSDGQPLDDDIEKFVDFKGMCEPCTTGCGGGCAEGFAYRNKKCVASCNMTNEETVTLD
jgi:hypothetical protein